MKIENLNYKIPFQQTIFNQSNSNPKIKWQFAQEQIIRSIRVILGQIIGNSTIMSININGNIQQICILGTFIESIIGKKKQWNCTPEQNIYISFFEKEDYNELVNLAKIGIELIERIRPEIICDNIIKLVEIEKQRQESEKKAKSREHFIPWSFFGFK